MKPARIIVMIVALAAGGIAALLAGRSEHAAPPPAPAAAPQLETVDVLVAGSDIGLGVAVAAQDLRWQLWPAAASASFIRKSDRPNAIAEIAGSITRQSFAAGEPIREARLIKANGSGFMAAILPQGMVAVATEVSPESGAGGFILPNDRVDVILSRREREADKGGADPNVSEIVLSNVRVLAIDQTIEEKAGQRVLIGRTATLELTPGQAEGLARAKQAGTLTLALRSIADAKTQAPVDEGPRRGGINVVRFGITTPTILK